MEDLIASQRNVWPVGYLRWPLRLLAAVMVSHLVTVEGQEKSSLELFGQLNYWVAIAVSVPVAFILIQIIHSTTLWLDSRYGWVDSWAARLVLQFLFGVLLVLFLDVLLIRGYFKIFNNDFEKSGYMTVEFPIIKWMVVSMNILYAAWYFADNFLRSASLNRELSNKLFGFYDREKKDEGYHRSFEARLGNKVVRIDPMQVACFEREENVGYVWMRDGRRFNIDLKMRELVEMLDPCLFYQINRSVVISLGVVTGFEKVKNKQGQLILSAGVEVEVPLLVSRYRYDGFKKVFAEYVRS